MPSISFLILTYNSEKHLDLLFSSLTSTIGNGIKNGTYEIIIVDNQSTDGTFEQVKKYTSENVHVFQNSKNGGYANGINFAAKKAHAPLLVVINPDARLVEEKFDRVLDEFNSNGRLAIVGLPIETEEGIKELTAGKFYNPLSFLLFCLGLEGMVGQRFSPTKQMKVDFVSGGFVVFKSEFFEKLKGYDEDYFMYVEDMDICYRAKKMGLEVYFLPYGKIIHKGQGSSSREFAIVNIYKGLITFYKKHGSFMEELYVRNLLSIKAALIIFLGSILGKRELVSTYSKALRDIS